MTQTEWDQRVQAEYVADNLTAHYRAVLLALPTFRGHGGQIFPSHQALAARTVASGQVRTCSVRTVERALIEARALGLVWWLPQHRRMGWRRLRSANLYFLNVPAGPAKSANRRVWPRCLSDRQADRVKFQQGKKEALQAMIRESAGAPDLLAARRRVMEARLMAR